MVRNESAESSFHVWNDGIMNEQTGIKRSCRLLEQIAQTICVSTGKSPWIKTEKAILENEMRDLTMEVCSKNCNLF